MRSELKGAYHGMRRTDFLDAGCVHWRVYHHRCDDRLACFVPQLAQTQGRCRCSGISAMSAVAHLLAFGTKGRIIVGSTIRCVKPCGTSSTTHVLRLAPACVRVCLHQPVMFANGIWGRSTMHLLMVISIVAGALVVVLFVLYIDTENPA